MAHATLFFAAKQTLASFAVQTPVAVCCRFSRCLWLHEPVSSIAAAGRGMLPSQISFASVAVHSQPQTDEELFKEPRITIDQIPDPGAPGMEQWEKQLKEAMDDQPNKPWLWPLPHGGLHQEWRMSPKSPKPVSVQLDDAGCGRLAREEYRHTELTRGWDGRKAVLKAVHLEADSEELLHGLLNEIATYHWISQRAPQLLGKVTPEMLAYGYSRDKRSYGLIVSHAPGIPVSHPVEPNAVLDSKYDSDLAGDLAENFDAAKPKVLRAIRKLHKAGILHGGSSDICDDIIVDPKNGNRAMIQNFVYASVNVGTAQPDSAELKKKIAAE